MNLKELTLEEWFLKKTTNNAFPNFGRDYLAMYADTADYLYSRIHTEVNIGALLMDKSLLTDHGPGHIRTVIKRATALVSSENCKLTRYEVFLLLSAIHLHDVGNTYGRENHEKMSRIIQRNLGALAANDDVERRVIFNIAESHGGEPPDKLDKLPPVQPIFDFQVRIQLLAAILKFADELADDFSRASKQPWHQIPHKNQVFHKFSECLKNVDIDHKSRTVNLYFSLNENDALQKFGKSDHSADDIYLVDEIYKRTFKTHLERVYCMRFMTPDIRLDSVSVKIEFFDEDHKEVREPIGYRLEERGYPSNPIDGFKVLCPEVNCTGESIKNEIEEKRRSK